jgi:hypothetical protein
MLKLLRLAACSLGIACAAPVIHAAGLVSNDLFVRSDGLVTLDTASNLQWLDISQTEGHSIEELRFGYGGWLAKGFRFATFEELKGFLSSAGMQEQYPYTSPTGGAMVGSVEVGQRLLALVGSTFQDEFRGMIAPRPCGSWHSNVCDIHLLNGEVVETDSYTYRIDVRRRLDGTIKTIDPSGPSPIWTTLITTRDRVGVYLVREAPPRYTFSGFMAPVSNLPKVNAGRAGRTFPLKWQLKDAIGDPVSELAAVKSISFKSTSCAAFTTDPTDAIEALSAGGSDLRFDADSGQFQYNWATPGPAGCYTLFLTVEGGQTFSANFSLR